MEWITIRHSVMGKWKLEVNVETASGSERSLMSVTDEMELLG